MDLLREFLRSDGRSVRRRYRSNYLRCNGWAVRIRYHINHLEFSPEKDAPRLKGEVLAKFH